MFPSNWGTTGPASLRVPEALGRADSATWGEFGAEKQRLAGLLPTEEDLSPGRRPEAHAVPGLHGRRLALAPPCARRSGTRVAPRHLARTMPMTLHRLG